MSNSLKHVAFILDGNRRWAREKDLPVLSGHEGGFEAVKNITALLPKYGIKYVTYYMFSIENWNRSLGEIKYLMKLFEKVFYDIKDFVAQHNIRIIAIGDLSRLPESLRQQLELIEDFSGNNSALTVVLAISYSGRDEIVRAVKRFACDVVNQEISIDDLTEDKFASYLDTKEVPYPDVIVRTSEMRISNFLIWQLAYSEMFFVNKYWPDFNEDDLSNIVTEFSRRGRRYGK